MILTKVGLKSNLNLKQLGEISFQELQTESTFENEVFAYLPLNEEWLLQRLLGNDTVKVTLYDTSGFLNEKAGLLQTQSTIKTLLYTSALDINLPQLRRGLCQICISITNIISQTQNFFCRFSFLSGLAKR